MLDTITVNKMLSNIKTNMKMILWQFNHVYKDVYWLYKQKLVFLPEH